MLRLKRRDRLAAVVEADISHASDDESAQNSRDCVSLREEDFDEPRPGQSQDDADERDSGRDDSRRYFSVAHVDN